MGEFDSVVVIVWGLLKTALWRWFILSVFDEFMLDSVYGDRIDIKLSLSVTNIQLI